MKRHSVRWADVAASDLARIIDFIARDSPINAGRVADTLEALARSLEYLPGRGRVVRELIRHGVRDWLEIGAAPWRLIYRVKGRQVEVVALVDGRRQLDDLLFERLMASG